MRNYTTKPFNLELALAGHPLITRDGQLANNFKLDPFAQGPTRFKYGFEIGQDIYFCDGLGSYHSQGESSLDLFLYEEMVIKTTSSTWSKAHEGIWIGLALLTVLLLGFVAGVLVKQQQGAELYHPDFNYAGARIPGTNYVVNGSDTLEIVKYTRTDYTYRLLNQAERRQAREYIKRLNQ